MSIHKYLQLGLPLGSCILIIGLMELTQLLTFCGYDLVTLLYLSYGIEYEHGQISGSMIASEVIITVYKAGCTCLLWFAIFKGNSALLLVWTVSAAFFPLFGIPTGIIYGIEGHFNTWGFCTTLFTVVLTTSYQVLIGHWTRQGLSRGEVLQPIGKGAVYVWEYLCSDLFQAAKFFIVAEMVLDAQYMLFRGIYFIFGDSYHPAILTENVIMTLVRLVMDAIGLYLVSKEIREKVGLWCVGVGIQILISTGLFVIILIYTVTGKDGNVIGFIGVFLFYPVHLIFRSIVLYFPWSYARSNLGPLII